LGFVLWLAGSKEFSASKEFPFPESSALDFTLVERVYVIRLDNSRDFLRDKYVIFLNKVEVD